MINYYHDSQEPEFWMCFTSGVLESLLGENPQVYQPEDFLRENTRKKPGFSQKAVHVLRYQTEREWSQRIDGKATALGGDKVRRQVSGHNEGVS